MDLNLLVQGKLTQQWYMYWFPWCVTKQLNYNHIRYKRLQGCNI